MEVIREAPPNYEEIKKVLSPHKYALYTHGEKVYAPNLDPTEELENHVLVHERVHMNQQGDSVEEWWGKYLADPEFRLAQEVEAYAAQYAYILSTENSAKEKARALDHMSSMLSSSQYRTGLSQGEAASKIRNAAKEIAM